MRSKAAITAVLTLALLLLWVPSASAKAKWSYGNGQSDLAVDTVGSGPNGEGVCSSGVISGLAGEGTSEDPLTTTPPAPSTSGFEVELYVAPSNQPLDGGTFVTGGLQLPDDSVIPPVKSTTTEPPHAIDPFDNVYYDFQDNPIWEYSAAPFTLTLGNPIPASSNVAVHLVGRSAYVTTVAVDCTTTTLTSSKNPSSSGESVTFTATVKDEGGTPVASKGAVKFSVDGGASVYGPVPVDATGHASITTSVLSDGSHEVVADFAGGAFDHLGSSTDSVTQQVGSSTTDSTPPTFGACTGGPFLFRTGARTVSITAADEVGGSGLDAAASALTGKVRTGGVGLKKVTFTAVDNAGNTATKTCRYRVKYVFTGFTPPVDNDQLNVATAGLTVPLRFTVTDGKGQPVTDLTKASRSVVQHACQAGPSDALEEYASGPGGLQNLGGGAYQFNLTTAKSWAGSCRTVSITLGDGLARGAELRFRA